MAVQVVGCSPLGVTLLFRHEKFSGIIKFCVFRVKIFGSTVLTKTMVRVSHVRVRLESGRFRVIVWVRLLGVVV